MKYLLLHMDIIWTESSVRHPARVQHIFVKVFCQSLWMGVCFIFSNFLVLLKWEKSLLIDSQYKLLNSMLYTCQAIRALLEQTASLKVVLIPNWNTYEYPNFILIAFKFLRKELNTAKPQRAVLRTKILRRTKLKIE